MALRRARQSAVGGVRSMLRRVAVHPRGRRLLDRAVGELSAAVNDAVDERAYGAAYFGRSRPKRTDQGTITGYARYDRASSNLDDMAYLAWRFLPVRSVLDVGAAMGFLVEALRELGVDAVGVEYSEYAARHAAPGAAGHLLQGDLLHGLPFRDGCFEAVTAFETLEHLPPESVPAAVAELARVAASWVMVSIPSFGVNRNGQHGWIERKVRDDVLDRYWALGQEYRGPVPHEDLYRDADGNPVEGHLTIASFAWWEERFAAAGLQRCDDAERAVNQQLGRLGLANLYNVYVLRHAGAQPPLSIRGDAEVREAEHHLGLRERRSDPPPPLRYATATTPEAPSRPSSSPGRPG